MTADRITARSPLATWAAAFADQPSGVRIAELPFLTQLDLRVAPDSAVFVAVGNALGGDLPTRPCTAARVGDVDALWLGPDEWLLLAEPGRQAELTDLIEASIGDGYAAVVDVSAQRTALSMSGPATLDLLAHGCAIDLDPRVAPPGTCVQTLLARTGVTIVVRDEPPGEFLVLVRASFADYLAAWLVDATSEL